MYFFSLRNNFVPLRFYTPSDAPAGIKKDSPACASCPHFLDTDILSFGVALNSDSFPRVLSVKISGVDVKYKINKIDDYNGSSVYLINIYPTREHIRLGEVRILSDEVVIVSECFFIFAGEVPFDSVGIWCKINQVNFFDQVGEQFVRLSGRIEPRLKQDQGDSVTYMNGYKVYRAEGSELAYSLKLGGTAGFDFYNAQRYAIIINNTDVLKLDGIKYQQDAGAEYQYPEGYNKTTINIDLLKYEEPRDNYYLIGGRGAVLIDEDRNTVAI